MRPDELLKYLSLSRLSNGIVQSNTDLTKSLLTKIRLKKKFLCPFNLLSLIFLWAVKKFTERLREILRNLERF